MDELIKKLEAAETVDEINECKAAIEAEKAREKAISEKAAILEGMKAPEPKEVKAAPAKSLGEYAAKNLDLDAMRMGRAKSAGTGFGFKAYTDPQVSQQMLVTSQNVVDNAIRDLEVRSAFGSEQISGNALKYFILKVDARKNMLFNPEESIDFNGNTGPFIQYTYARIRSILRKWSDEITLDGKAFEVSLAEKEISLIQRLQGFEAAVRQAGQDYNPSCIANYCYELVKEYNQFYHDFSVLHEEDKAKQQVRLVLSAAVAQVVKNGMGLLGIEVPERM